MTQGSNPFSQMLVSLQLDRFYGRRAEVSAIVRGVSASAPRSFAIDGIKTIGKTSLAQHVQAICANPVQAEGYQGDFEVYGRPGGKPLFFHCINCAYRDAESCLCTLVEDLLAKRELAQLIDPDIVRAVQSRLQPAPSEVAASPERGGLSVGLKDALNLLLRALARADIRLVVCLDDFDAAFRSLSRDDSIFLRSLVMIQAFLIVTERPLVELVDDVEIISTLILVLNHRSLPTLSESEARDLLTHPFHGSKDGFTDAEIQFLLATAGRQPYLLTLVAAYLYDRRLRDPDVPAMIDDLYIQERIQADMIEQPAIRQTLNLLLSRVKDLDEQVTLAQIISGAEVSQLKRPAGLPRLRQKALVSERLHEKRLVIFSELFRAYVARHLVVPETVDTEAVRQSVGPVDRQVLDYLMARSGQEVTFDELKQEVWGDADTSSRGLEAAIHRLRGAFVKHDPDGSWQYIQNVRGRGYRYVPRPT